jgi:hypothetical protein
MPVAQFRGHQVTVVAMPGKELKPGTPEEQMQRTDVALEIYVAGAGPIFADRNGWSGGLYKVNRIASPFSNLQAALHYFGKDTA